MEPRVSKRVRIEIKGRDEFWQRAFHVEWEDQYPDRKLTRIDDALLVAEPEWLDDLNRVAAQCFCSVELAPENPRRRRWIRSLIPRR